MDDDKLDQIQSAGMRTVYTCALISVQHPVHKPIIDCKHKSAVTSIASDGNFNSNKEMNGYKPGKMVFTQVRDHLEQITMI